MRALKPEEVADLIVSEVLVVRYSAVDHCIVGQCDMADMLQPHGYITTYIVVELVPRQSPIFSIQVVGMPKHRIICCGGGNMKQHPNEVARCEFMCHAANVNPLSAVQFLESVQPRVMELIRTLNPDR